MKNQLYTGTSTSRRQVALPVSVKAGDPLLVGNRPCVALDDYQANIGGATCLFNGSFSLTVAASSSHSPYTPAAINPGDKIYAFGTLDAPTNVTYALTLTGDVSDTLFGNLDPTGPGIVGGQVQIAGVVINAI